MYFLITYELYSQGYSNLVIAITINLASHAQVPTLKLATAMPSETT